jgi:hypothetical protein
MDKYSTIIVRTGRDSDPQHAARFGIRTPMEARRFPILHTRLGRPRGPPSFLYYGYCGCFLGVKRPECDVEHQPRLAPMLGNSTAVPLFPLCACIGILRGDFYSYNFTCLLCACIFCDFLSLEEGTERLSRKEAKNGYREVFLCK